MNVPPFSGDDRELRLTALLLGELPEAEAAALREEIAANPELQKLHDELFGTIGLVREARNESPEVLGPSTEPLTLSAERREKLLDSFKTVLLPTPAKKIRRILPWREAGAVAAMLAVLAGVTVLLVRTSVLPEDRLAESMDFLYAGVSKEEPGGVTARSAWIQSPEDESTIGASSKGIARAENPASGGDFGYLNRGSREQARSEVKGFVANSRNDGSIDRLEEEAIRRLRINPADQVANARLEKVKKDRYDAASAQRDEVARKSLSQIDDTWTPRNAITASGAASSEIPNAAPPLAEIPGLGALFRSSDRDADKSTLGVVNGTFGSGAKEPVQNAAVAGPQDANGRLFYSRSEVSGVPARSVNTEASESLSRRYRFGGDPLAKNLADQAGTSVQSADQNTPAPEGGALRYGNILPASVPSGSVEGGLGGGGGGFGGGVRGPSGGRATLSAADRFDAASKAKPASARAEAYDYAVPEAPKAIGIAAGAVADSETALGLSRLQDLSRDGSSLNQPPPSPPSQSLAWFEGKVAQVDQTLGTPVQFADLPQTWELKTEAQGRSDDFYFKPAAASEPEARFKRNAVDQKAAEFATAGQKAEGQLGERENVALSFGVDAADRSSAGVPINNPKWIGALGGRATSVQDPEPKDRLQVVAASSGVDGTKDLEAIMQRGIVLPAGSETKLGEVVTAGKPVQGRPVVDGAVDDQRGDTALAAMTGLSDASSVEKGAALVRQAEERERLSLIYLVTQERDHLRKTIDDLASKPISEVSPSLSPKSDATKRIENGLAVESKASAQYREPKERAMESLRAQLERTERRLLELGRDPEQSKASLIENNTTKADDAPVPRKPAPNAAVPQPEVATAENAFSTFSLNVSDVSFKLAAASLEKGVMPDAASVRTEEFINAFDYRDPEPTPGVPVAFATERARYPFAHDRDLVRFSVKTAAAGRQPGKPYNLVLAIDNSGSMERADRVRILQECLRVLSRQLQPQDKISVVSFARTARLWMDGLAGNAFGELPQMIGTLTPEGGTNLEEAMNLAYKTALRHFVAGGVNRVVLITDGAANLGAVEPDSLKQQVEAFRKQGVALDCFGIGWDGLNDDLLEVLSRNGDGRYGFINTPEAAATDFAGQLAGALKVAASDVKVQVEWNPRRVLNYRQIGYAKHQLTKEQFRDNTVDAAEIAAAEAGNALYTVQINPAGEGPLGTVRVRFRVPNTSDYREHEWIVPYAGPAPALDQASSTLRLAATASAFSEWLVASPFAAEVTPSKLLGYLQGVPEIAPADPRPRQLETMIRKAKTISGQ